jgi:5-hydroxyisourate hydrolase
MATTPTERRLTTHVLDTMSGRPAAGMAFRLSRLDGTARSEIRSGSTNGDGRCDAPLLAGADMMPGLYELEFDVGGYFAKAAPDLAGDFLATVPVRFRIDAAPPHLHVPLLVSPYGYSTYRGS